MRKKGAAWQHALDIFRKMERMKIEANTISYSAAISACEEQARQDSMQFTVAAEWNKTPALIDLAIANCDGEIMAAYNYIKGFTASVLERDNARKWIEENYKANQ